MLVISNFSSTHFSASKTAPFIECWLQTLFPSLNIATIHFIHIITRKFAHFSEFGIFAILVFGIFAAKETLWRLQWFGYTLITVVSLALLDEYHQAFIRNRNASLEDSLLDIFGGVVCLFLIRLVKKINLK